MAFMAEPMGLRARRLQRRQRSAGLAAILGLGLLGACHQLLFVGPAARVAPLAGAGARASELRLGLGASLRQELGGGKTELNETTLAMPVLWVNRPDQASFEVRWAPEDTIGALKVLIAKETDVPAADTELRCNGQPMGEDDLKLDDWIVQAGGITAEAAKRGPDVWAFDMRADDEKDIVYPGGSYFEDEEEEEFFYKYRTVVYGLVGFAVLYVVTQAIGINPLNDTGKIDWGEVQEIWNQKT